jgi:hypothetical protein
MATASISIMKAARSRCSGPSLADGQVAGKARNNTFLRLAAYAASAFSSQGPSIANRSCDRTTGVVLRGTESLLTHHWREMDSNFQYASTVRWHRATDLPLPPTVRSGAPRGPLPMARPRSEAQRDSVRSAAMGPPIAKCGSAAVQAACYWAASRRHRAARRHRTFANGKIPVARPGRHRVEFRLVREENGNALPGDRARRSRPGARQPLGRSEGAAAGPPSMRRAAMRAAAVKCRWTRRNW